MEQNKKKNQPQTTTPPFEGPYKTKPSAIAGKKGIGYSTVRHLARLGMKKVMTKEDVEQVDELNKSTLASYAKKASKDVAFKRTIATDFDNASKKYRKPDMKTASARLAMDYRQKARKREDNMGKAIDRLAKEEVEMNEAVTVKKANYSWGKMITVHHGSDTSYPLHPEHQKAIAGLKSGEKTSFKDETNRTVHAEREGDKVHLYSKGTGTKTTVAHSNFTESASFKSFRSTLQEKTLTPAEKKKREEVAQAIERENPKMPMAMKMAIATKTAKRVAEENELEERVKTTHEDPLVTVHDKDGLHTHANLSTANHIFRTNVKHTDVHKGPVNVKSGGSYGMVKFAISKHHAKAMNEELDDEGKMAKGQLMRMVNQASALAQMMEDDKQLDGWVQSKLTMASDYLDSVHDYLMHNKQDVDEQIEEGESIVSRRKTKADFLVPPKGTYAYERRYGEYTAKGELRKRPNPNKPPAVKNEQGVAEEVELDEAKSLATMSMDELKAKHDEVTKKINDAGRSKMISMNHPLSQQRRAIKLHMMIKQQKAAKGMSEEIDQQEDQHYCAKHVRSSILGDGVVLEAQHAEPDENGNIEWYMVEFTDGIHKVYTEDLEIMLAEYHGNHKKKKR